MNRIDQSGNCDEKSSGLLGWLHGSLRIREPLCFSMRIALGVVPILLILGIWAFATRGEAEMRWITPTILPSPWEVATSFKKLWFEAELSRSVLISAARILGGFGVALAIALPVGVLMGSFSKFKALFEPLAIFGAYMPIPVLVPLTLSLFGMGEKQKILFLAIAFLVYLLPLIVHALDQVDEIFLQTAYTLGASKLEAVWHVLLGIAWPRIFQAMRLGFGVGWSYIILAEMIDAPSGLGHIILMAQRRGPREHIYLTFVIIVLIAYITDKLWARLGKWLFPYEEAK